MGESLHEAISQKQKNIVYIPVHIQSNLNITIISVSSKPIVILRLIAILRL